ncbi:MAG: hypothetical protein WBV78_12325 [Roseobacter sp.]
MAPVATLLGGLVGTIASIVAMVFFGASFAMAAAIYFCAGLSVTSIFIAGALVVQRNGSAFPVIDRQDAGLTRQT